MRLGALTGGTYALGAATVLANPYLIFERDEAAADRVSFGVIDRGAPAEAVRPPAPLEHPTQMTDAIDKRRVRALMVHLLEDAIGDGGHTVVPRSWLVQRALAAPLEPKCAIDEDVIAINSAWLADVLAEGKTGDEPAYKLRRYAVARDMISTAIRKRIGAKRHGLTHNWGSLVDAELGAFPASEADRKDEERARREKAAALQQIAQSRFSVLVGPAGCGKTTLLRLLCELPQVSERKVLLLAPTGKDRMRLEEATGRLGQGKRFAQFLQGLDRYDGASGRYYWNPAAPREKGYRTVIVDESSRNRGTSSSRQHHHDKGAPSRAIQRSHDGGSM